VAERNMEDGYGSRYVGHVGGSQNELEGIDVEHIYGLEPTPCPEGHGVHMDPGVVGLHVQGVGGGEDNFALLYLHADEALQLAFLMQRAVGWIHDSNGDPVDPEREAARYMSDFPQEVRDV
jgi:hypothetical protein